MQACIDVARQCSVYMNMMHSDDVLRQDEHESVEPGAWADQPCADSPHWLAKRTANSLHTCQSRTRFQGQTRMVVYADNAACKQAR